MSGGFLTWQAALGPKRSENWDLIHLITGTAACVLLVVHLLMAFSRRGHALSRQPELAAAARRFSMQTAAWVSATALLIFLGALAWPQRPVDLPLPEGYSLSGYLEQFDEYRGSPFAPTYARTASGMLVDPEVISHSESCGSAGCHEQILAEWQPSAHRFSAMNPPFQEVQLAFAKDRDVAETRYCAGCHDPISLFAGAKDIAHSGLEAPGAREGASCAVCHSISKVDQRGNGDYVRTENQPLSALRLTLTDDLTDTWTLDTSSGGACDFTIDSAGRTGTYTCTDVYGWVSETLTFADIEISGEWSCTGIYWEDDPLTE